MVRFPQVRCKLNFEQIGIRCRATIYMNTYYILHIYSTINSTKYPASDTGNISETMLMSQVGEVL